MGSLIFPLTLFIFLMPFDLESAIQWLALPLHELCMQLAPTSNWRASYQALVCGSNLPESEFLDALRSTSLLHIAIVSGSHLILVEVILRKFLPQKLTSFSLIFFCLFCYSLLSGWQPPAVRALSTLILQHLNSRLSLFWSGSHVTWVAGLLTWALFPQWGYSFSFLLSWGASLALTLLPDSYSLKIYDQWKTHLLVYLLLVPLLTPFGGTHPLSVLCNWILGPIFSIILFPVSLIAFILPFTSQWIDWVWLFSEKTISYTGQWIPHFEFKADVSVVFLWFYLFSLQVFFHFFELRKKRLTW